MFREEATRLTGGWYERSDPRPDELPATHGANLKGLDQRFQLEALYMVQRVPYREISLILQPPTHLRLASILNRFLCIMIVFVTDMHALSCISVSDGMSPWFSRTEDPSHISIQPGLDAAIAWH
jgi:hypothetical protein